MTERRVDTSPQFRAVASGMNLSLDLSHKAASPLRSPPVHVGGTSSQPYSSPPPSGARLTPKPVAIDMPSRAMLTRTSRGLRTVRTGYAYQPPASVGTAGTGQLAPRRHALYARRAVDTSLG